jgi:uncharacterized delta-60 repeat protein
MKKLLFIILSIVMAVQVISCSSGGSDSSIGPVDRSGSAFISSAEGGRVYLNDEVVLSVPSNSISKDAEISIERITDAPAGSIEGLRQTGQAYKFTPAGTTFEVSIPATAEISYNEEALVAKGLSPKTLQLYYYDEELERYVAVPTRVNEVRGVIQATIEHFTKYVTFAKTLAQDNNIPTVSLMNPVPNPIRAGAPIYLRAQVRDHESGGSIAGVKVYYRKLQPTPGPWQSAYMEHETHPDSLQIYGYLIPADFLNPASDLGAGDDLEFYVEATDNIGTTNITDPASPPSMTLDITRTYQAGTLSVYPANQEITAGFQRHFTVRGQDNLGTNFTLVPETYNTSDSKGPLSNNFAQGLLFKAEIATDDPFYLEAGFGAENATSSITIYNGELKKIDILDTNSLPLGDTFYIDEGETYEFDVVGYDEFNNIVYIKPGWLADPSIGIVDEWGKLNTTGCTGEGSLQVILGRMNDSQNIKVYSRVKEMLTFSINGVSGTIEADDDIVITLPTATSLLSLVSNFSFHGETVRVGTTEQISGTTSNNFSEPVQYKVYAENGSWREYNVIIDLETWAKTYGGSGHEEANAIAQTSDGGYILAGYTESNDNQVSGNHGNKDFWILKVNVAGHIEWQRCFGGLEDDVATSIEETSDGGYIVAGYTDSNTGDIQTSNGARDFWVIKLNSQGNIEWKQCYGGQGDDEANHITETPDGGFIVVGSTRSTDILTHHGNNDVLVIKLNASGGIEWQRCYGGTNNDYGNKIRLTPDGGYIFAGRSASNNGDVSGRNGFYADAWVVKIDSSGNINWQLCVGASYIDYAEDIQVASDGSFIIVGRKGGLYNSSMLVSRITSSGDLIFLNSYDDRPQSNGHAYSVIESQDNGFLILGRPNPVANDRMTLLKIDNTGLQEWIKEINFDDSVSVGNILLLPDEKIIISGSTKSTSGDITTTFGGFDFLLMKLNSNGDL